MPFRRSIPLACLSPRFRFGSTQALGSAQWGVPYSQIQRDDGGVRDIGKFNAWRLQYLTEKLPRALVAALCKEVCRWPVLDHHAAIGEVDLVGDFASKAHLVGDDDAGHAILGELADGDQNLFHGFRI